MGSSIANLRARINEHEILDAGGQLLKGSSSTANVHQLTLGIGHSVYTDAILPAVEQTEYELIIVTCFWAKSATLNSLNDTLRRLSAKCNQSSRTIRVRICFSSNSLFQKLFHTTSLHGRTYTSMEWQTKLSLPSADELTGLDLEVKSIFVLPFSVMHPKFVIVDRSRVFMPSCNVSWEDWFEGCVELSGAVVSKFFDFWQKFWASSRDRGHIGDLHRDTELTTLERTRNRTALSRTSINLEGVPCHFLPSSHHQNPRFALLPWRSCPPPPPTPLNNFVLTAIAKAARTIYVQTPNLTSPPVLSALLKALKRGVDVTIITSQRLMIVEQLLTAGTTTQRCVGLLKKRHARLIKENHAASPDRVETGAAHVVGLLKVYFYRPNIQTSNKAAEPVQSHIKVTVIDGEITVLGSGNMDRASWYTSQELGAAFFDVEFASTTRRQLDNLMQHRTSR